ncbi:hypothetical protein WAI453_008392 [Rhynchosporium graminicola]
MNKRRTWSGLGRFYIHSPKRQHTRTEERDEKDNKEEVGEKAIKLWPMVDKVALTSAEKQANSTEVHRWIETMKTPSNQAQGSDVSKKSGYGLQIADFKELRQWLERKFKKRTAATIAKKIIQARLEASPSRSHTFKS